MPSSSSPFLIMYAFSQRNLGYTGTRVGCICGRLMVLGHTKGSHCTSGRKGKFAATCTKVLLCEKASRTGYPIKLVYIVFEIFC